jgi:hypothetical protein
MGAALDLRVRRFLRLAGFRTTGSFFAITCSYVRILILVQIKQLLCAPLVVILIAEGPASGGSGGFIGFSWVSAFRRL